MRRAAIVLVLLLVAGLAAADEKDAFYAAADLDKNGHPAEAAAAYLALADRAPRDPFADDALLEAARLYEEQLGKPREAAETYERIVRDYPSSRVALRAKRRAEELREGLGGGEDDAALAEFNEILYGFARRPRGESMDRLEKLLAEHPDFGAAPRATYWLGTLEAQEGHDARALARFRETQTRWPDSEWARRARKSEGDVLVARHDWDGARAAYESLRGTGDPAQEQVVEDALRSLGAARTQFRASIAAWIALALFAAAAVLVTRRTAGSFRPLTRPPLEVLYLTPVAAIFAAAAATENSAIGGAVLMIAVGGLVVTWLSGATMAAARASGRVTLVRATSHAAATTAAVAALFYLAIYRNGLIELVLNTLRSGVE